MTQEAFKEKAEPVFRIAVKVLMYLLLCLFCIAMLLPFYWSIVSSFRPEIENQDGFSLWPQVFTLEQYQTFFESMADVGAGISVFQIFGNTIFIVISVIVLSLLTCSLGAYALTHLHLPGEKVILKIMTASMMLPGVVSLIPSFLVVDYLGLTNTFGAVIVPAAFSIYGVLFARRNRGGGAHRRRGRVLYLSAHILPAHRSRADHAGAVHVQFELQQLPVAVHRAGARADDVRDRAARISDGRVGYRRADGGRAHYLHPHIYHLLVRAEVFYGKSGLYRH